MLSQKKSQSNFWTMKQEKGTLIQCNTVNSQIFLITGSWGNLVNEKPSTTIPLFAKLLLASWGGFISLVMALLKGTDPAWVPNQRGHVPLTQHFSLEGLYRAVYVASRSTLQSLPTSELFSPESVSLFWYLAAVKSPPE